MDAQTLQIQLNGEPRSFVAPLHLRELLVAEGLGDRRVAIDVNGAIIPRALHASHRVASGDRIEIVHALGGG